LVDHFPPIMIANVFKAVQRGIEMNKQSFLQLRQIDNVDISFKWGTCLQLFAPVEAAALKQYNISPEEFNKLYNREFRKLYLETSSQLVDHVFGFENIELLSNDKVHLVSELFLKDLASKQLRDFVAQLSLKDCSDEAKMAGLQRYLVTLQMSHLRHFKKANPKGWIELMLSFHVFTMSYNPKYIEKMMKKQDKLTQSVYESISGQKPE
jgi:hypothetical protein